MIPNDTAARAVEHLGRLVAFDTVSSRSNLALIDWAAGLLDSGGARLRRTASDDGTKCNLLATFGPADAPGGIVLSGHTDVVPTEGQPWTSDPFSLTRRGDRLVGRGAADMKGFIACCMAVLPQAAAGGAGLRRPVHLALSYDEEVGCLGAPRLVADLVAAGALPTLAVVGEPTLMRVATAHKSANLFHTCFTGLEAHSSRSDLGCSALVHAADFVAWLRDRFAANEVRRSGVPGLQPPWSTFNVGRLEGGTAVNIIPREARMLWEYRGIPELDTEAETAALLDYLDGSSLPRMRRLHPGSEVRTERLACVPALDPRGNRAAREALRAVAGVEGDDAVAFGTEAGIFQAAGIPAVVCGPGSIDVAHKPDEYVELAQMEAAVAMVGRILAWAARVER